MFTHEINMSENLTAVEGQPHTLTSRVNIFQKQIKKKPYPSMEGLIYPYQAR